jgi:2-polyprenyl-6-hydroxyphenyl methylase/3-demethylubiquinone-9 3-methyltransferase
MTVHQAEIDAGSRFPFGENWRNFLETIDEQRIALAEKSLCELLQRDRLTGYRFIDIGSGSGLFSLAARRLGAVVFSFDFDPQSVACTAELRRRFCADDPNWTVGHGSILDAEYAGNLGQWDIVYSWGVLHHTGALWAALEQVSSLVTNEGELVLAIYNDQGRGSRSWLQIKRLYNRLPPSLRWLLLLPVFARLWGPTFVRDVLRGKPSQSWREYAQESVRGMSPWFDFIDWVGGLPFEVAKPEDVFDFFRARGFTMCRLKTCAGGIGCNEYVFRKQS